MLHMETFSLKAIGLFGCSRLGGEAFGAFCVDGASGGGHGRGIAWLGQRPGAEGEVVGATRLGPRTVEERRGTPGGGGRWWRTERSSNRGLAECHGGGQRPMHR